MSGGEQVSASEAAAALREVTAGEFASDPELAVEVRRVAGEAGLGRPLRHPRVQKPGLALAGHFYGVVHRDIKPANLLLVTPPEGFPLPAGMPLVKVADFGLALLAAEEGRA